MSRKTDTEMVFTVERDNTYTEDTLFSYLATPITPPRTLIEYGTIGNRDLGEIRRQFIISDSEPLHETLPID